MRITPLLLPVLLVSAVPLAAAEPVAVSAFRSVELNGGGTVTIRPGPAQRVTITSGSSQFTRVWVDREGKLEIDACNGSCPRHYDLRIEIQSPRMPDVAIHGGGQITAAAGFTPQPQLAAAIHGGGVIDVRQLRAAQVAAAIHGGGKIMASPARTLSAAINGGGEIRYTGNPEKSIAIHGGGEVRHD